MDNVKTLLVDRMHEIPADVIEEFGGEDVFRKLLTEIDKLEGLELIFMSKFLVDVRNAHIINPLYAAQQGLLLTNELKSLTVAETADRVALIMEMSTEEQGEGNGQLH